MVKKKYTTKQLWAFAGLLAFILLVAIALLLTYSGHSADAVTGGFIGAP